LPSLQKNKNKKKLSSIGLRGLIKEWIYINKVFSFCEQKEGEKISCEETTKKNKYKENIGPK
jgi:hypothetical protein